MLKNYFKKYKRNIIQLFSANTRVFFFNFANENIKKLASKVAHNRPQIIFFSIANQPNISPNLIFCSVKMAPCATLDKLIS